MNCLFCKIINDEIPAYKVWEDDNFLVFLDIHPIKEGHILVVPKVHTEDLFEMENSSYQELMSISKKIGLKLKQQFKSVRVGMLVEGFGVNHVHVHLMPLNAGNELNPSLAHEATEDYLKKTQEVLNLAFKDVS